MRIVVSAASVGVISLIGVSVPSRATGQIPEPGTYRVWLCADECAPTDSARAIGAATVVIVDEQAAAAEPVQSALGSLRAVEDRGTDDETANVCFHVDRRAPDVGGEELFFGIRPRGRTRWRHVAGEGFSLPVYRSPDAGYTLRWASPGPLTAVKDGRTAGLARHLTTETHSLWRAAWEGQTLPCAVDDNGGVRWPSNNYLQLTRRPAVPASSTGPSRPLCS